MKKKLIFILISFTLVINSYSNDKSFYSLSAELMNGEVYNFNNLKDKKVIIVNVASKCGNTPQYEEIEKLYKKYANKNLEILAFPANNFLNQEPGTNEDIVKFCEKNYKITFKLFKKIDVKGNKIHPIYKWLTSKKLNGVSDNEVKWNFQKFLIDQDGNFIKYIEPSTSIYNESIFNWIEN